MTLDESIQDTDEQVACNGLTILIDKTLFGNIGDLTVDFLEGQGITVAKTPA